MTTTITEIGPDIYRICTYVPEIDLQFAQFLVRDDEPLLFHTGMKQIFPAVRDAVGKIIDASKLRWISFSHFEPDESGSLNEWLEFAPAAQAICSNVGAAVFVNDGALRPARGLVSAESIETGKRRFRYYWTPHLPHGWDAGMLFEESTGTLFCSDLFHQIGDVEPMTDSDVVGRARHALESYQNSPFSNYLPYTPNTEGYLQQLAALDPKICATMHGSIYTGNGRQALLDLGTVYREVLGTPNSGTVPVIPSLSEKTGH